MKKYKDKIIGRPIRINRQELNLKDNKEYAELLFMGDIHFGHECCDIKRANNMRQYCLDKKVFVLGMGDYMEAGIRNSIGDSLFKQRLNPQTQLETIIEFFTPLANENLLLGLHSGNHEDRIYKETGLNPTKIMCNELKTRYLDSAMWNLFNVLNENYLIYSLHGSTGSRYVYTKLKSIVDISHNFDVDIIAMGHVHDIGNVATLVQYYDSKSKTIKEKR